MAVILFVRIDSNLEPALLERRMAERQPLFADVPGLIHKDFGRDPQTGSICGIYRFEDMASLEAYRGSDLGQSIAAAYEAVEVRREVYEVLFSP